MMPGMRLYPWVLLLAIACPAQTPHSALAQHPYMGWSSWSFLRSRPTEQKVKAQVDALFQAHLPDYGYRYINLDAGWSDGYDNRGIPQANLNAFPSGMDGFGAYLHKRGLHFGLYMNPGIDPKLYDQNPVIEGTTVRIREITQTDMPGSTHKGSYKIDFTKPAARLYIRSLVRQFAEWKVDFIKLDFVGPGGGNLPADNREEVREWHQAILAAHRPIWLELSNWLSIDQAPLWRTTSNGWRIENDIECYPCGRSSDPAIKGNLTTWAKVSERFSDVVPWINYAGPGTHGRFGGWNDFDSLEIGNGDKDGITPTERQTMFTFWAISCAPLYLGTDLTHLDSGDLAIMTNRNLIAINQAGRPASPLDIQQLRKKQQQAWFTRNADGSAILTLFNLGPDTASIQFRWDELDALRGTHFAEHPPELTDLVTNEAVSMPAQEIRLTLESHASRIFRLNPSH